MNLRPHSLADRALIGCAAAVALGIVVTGCSEHSQDLDERVTQLQKQLDQTQTELQAANKSLKTAKEEVARLTNERGRPAAAPPPATATMASATALPPRDALEKSYTAKAKTLKQDLQQKLTQFKVDSCTLYQIETSSPDYPVTSKISLAVRGNTGSSFHLDVPVKADRSGNWVFPAVTDIVQRIEELGRGPSAKSAQAPVRSVPGSAPAEPAHRGTGQRADKTVTIQWSDSPPAAPQQAQPSAPSVPAAPSASSAPANAPTRSTGSATQGVAANRTVVIQWPDGGKTSGAVYQPSAASLPAPPGPAPAQTQPPADRNVLVQF